MGYSSRFGGDLNNFKEFGCCVIEGANTQNKPWNTTEYGQCMAFPILLNKQGNIDGVIQLAFQVYGNPRDLYIRGCAANTWSAWKKIWEVA